MEVVVVSHGLFQGAQLFHRAQRVDEHRFQRKAGVDFGSLLHNTQDAVGQQRQGRSFLVLGQIAAGAFAADVFRTDGFLVVQGAADCGDGVFADGGVRIAQILVAAQHRDFDARLGESCADIRELGGGDIGKIRDAPDSLGHGQLGGVVAVGGQHISQTFGGKAPVIMGAAAVFHGGNLLV